MKLVILKHLYGEMPSGTDNRNLVYSNSAAQNLIQKEIHKNQVFDEDVSNQ